MPPRLEFELDLGRPPGAAPRTPGEPLRILVLGDFSGRAAARSSDTPEVVPIDIDNFEAVVRRIRPTVALDLPGGAGATLAIGSLDDFHPDHLYDTLASVAELRVARERLSDPRTWEAEAARLSGAPDGLPVEVPGTDAEAAQSVGADEDDQATLDRLLGASGTKRAGARPGLGPGKSVDRFIHDVVAPHITKGIEPRQERLLASVNEAISTHVRAALHAPAFQARESVWRALHWLVHAEDTGEDVQVAILDTTGTALREDLASCGGELEHTELLRRLLGAGAGSPGGAPWSLVIGDFRFDASIEDLTLLAGLGAIAARAGGPFIAAADPHLAGCDDLQRQPDSSQWHALDADAAARWKALRESPVAAWIGLAMPRIIGRVPYGRHSEPIERFDFTELLPDPSHEAFLWLNPAFVCARLIAAAYARSGWSMEIGAPLDVADLPLALFEQAGGTAIKPCAEVYLSHASADALLERGLMAFMSHRDRNAVRLAGFRSIARPVARLAGAWVK